MDQIHDFWGILVALSRLSPFFFRTQSVNISLSMETMRVIQ